MRKQDGSIRVMGGSGYKLSLVIIAVLAAALMVFMLVILPAIDQEPTEGTRIISIEYPQGEIGVGDNISHIYVQVSYSNGETASVALSDMVFDGLDLSEVGEQNVSLTYGGFEQVLNINVRSVNCQINYQVSTGGVIEGETSQSIPAGQGGNRVIARAEVGYVFVNWSDGNPNPERRDTNVTSDATYIANFEKARYIVVFRYPDGTVAREQIVPYNEKPTQVPPPSDPKMQVYGYEFNRWSIPFDNVTQNMTIDPIFVKRATDVSVEITKNNRGETLGTVDVPSEGYYPKNQQATLRAEPLQSRSFAGWQIKRYDGEWISITVEDMATQNGFRNISIGTQSNNINFEAGQTGDSKEYYLVFTPNDNTNFIDIKADFVYDISAITFINSMSPNQGNIEKTVNLENGVAIGAHLTEPDGSGLGYNFIGWFRAQSGAELNDEPVQPEDTFTMPTTLVARWQKVYYDVNFLTGDGNLLPRTVYVLYQNSLASAVEEPVYTNPVATQAIPSEIPYREHYRFMGWYIVGDGNILTDVVVDEDFKVYESINVRPKFEPIEHELIVNMDGPGIAQRRNLTQSGSFEEMPAGINRVEEINRYIYRFVADNGYQIKTVDVNGVVTNYSGNVEWADVEVFFPAQSKYISVEFIPKTYLVTIQNGLLNDEGSIRYTEKIGDTIVEKISNLSVVSFYIEHNTSKNVHITALATHFVWDIQIGGSGVENIPAAANEYTMVLSPDNIIDDTVITIQYSPFAFVVDFLYADNIIINEYEYDEVEDSYDSIPKNDTYDFGENPLFSFSAAEGYYLKGLIINGKAMDLYSPDMGFDIFNIVVNYTQESDDLTDERITQFILKIEEINSDYTIEPVFEEIYYNINVAYTGRGDIERDFETVNLGESIQIFASTDGGYYVKGYLINGDEFVFSDMLEVQIIDIEEIYEDIFVMVEFSIATYIIAFDGSSGGGRNSSVRYESQEKRPLNASYVAEHKSSNRFTVYADEGYYISFVSINAEEIVIPYKATELFMQIDNVTTYQHVVIKCSKLTYKVSATINNSEYGSITDEVVVRHGEDANLTITYESGYTLSSISEGLISEGNTLLTINNVTEDKYIYVELESLPPNIYTITLQHDENGSVQAPATAEHGEEVFIFISADYGYVIDTIYNNGVEVALLDRFGSYILSETITENSVVQVSFVEYAMTNPTIVNIYQQGGTVNGLEGDVAIEVYEDVYETVFIEAAKNYFIYSINGFVYAGQQENLIYTLDTAENQIDIEYRLTEFNLNLEPIQNGSAETMVSSLADENFVVSSEATINDYIRIYLNPDEGYELYEIRINGVLASTNVGQDNFYAYTGIEKNQNISVLFGPKRFVVTTEVTGGRGEISSPKNIFEYGQGLTINIMPDVGFNIKDVSVNGAWLEGAQLQNVITSNKLNIVGDSEYTKNNLLIRVNFQQINHDVEIELEGNGRIDQPYLNQIPYGEIYYIDITAGENDFIEAIEIDGIRIAVNNTNLQNYIFNNTTQRYTAGRYRLLVTSDVYVKVIFCINYYNINVLSSVNGQTKINLYENGDITDLDISNIEHGNFLQIAMEADNGYNISRLLINNNEITGFKNDNVNPNNNRLINYYYTGVNNQGVTGNILIRVDYEINSYKFEYQTVNESPNFSEFDIYSNSYGTISVLGSYSQSGNVYSGIPHGENFRISLNPVREKGYIISGVTITYNDPTNENQSLVYINPQVGGPGATILRTGTTVFFSELMGEYANSMVGDVQLIQIRFTKETFEYDNEVVTDEHTGTISTRFYHPNDSSRAYTFGSEEPTSLILVEGRFEFGLAFTVTVPPSAGYSRTAFYYLVNGTYVDRSNSVRGNIFNSTIQSNIDAKVEYVVNRHNIVFEYRVFNENDNLISNPGEEYGTIALIVGGQTVYPIDRKITFNDCTYGTELMFMLFPNYDSRGYYIQSFMVGTQNIFIENKNDPFDYSMDMGNNDLSAMVNFKINTYTINVELEGHDGRNSITSMTLGSIPWGRNVTLRIDTDPGYNLLSLDIYQNAEWHDRIGDIQYGVPQSGGPPIDILPLTSIKNNIIISASYERKEYDIIVTVNDLDLGAIQGDIVGDFYPNQTDIAQDYSQITEQTEGWVYDPIIDDMVWDTIDVTWDVITMKAKHYDELVFYILPQNGYKVYNHLGVEVSLFTYSGEERVPVLDNDLQPIVYNFNTFMSHPEHPDYRAFSISNGLYLTNNIEFEINFVIKEYDVTIEKSPSSLDGVQTSILTVEALSESGWEEIVSGSVLEHFEHIRINLETEYGLSLDQMIINGQNIPYSSYECDNNNYSYYYELQVNDELLNGLDYLNINARMQRNNYNIEIEIYDNKSEQTTYGKQASTVEISVVDIITHNNVLTLTPSLAEGYSITMVVINGEDYSGQISDLNSPFNLVASGSLVNDLDVEDSENNTLHFYIQTSINLHISSIRAFVYEQGVDTFSDIAGDTSVTYTPDDTMVIDGGVVKYEYFTHVRVEAVARETAGKTYRFAYYQEQVASSWVMVRDGERGVTLSGDDNSILEYQIKVDSSINVSGNRSFRAVYYRVLTVTVEVFNDYKYVSGYHSSDNMRYLPYLTVEANIGSTQVQDQNPANYPVYQQAQNTGDIPFVKTYIYYVDSGSYLRLQATDHEPRNYQTFAFYDRQGDQAFSVINNISTTGTRILDDRDIYLIGRNQTMLSYDIDTIANERGANGGSLSWQINTFENQSRSGTVFRGSLNNAMVLDVVTVTIMPAQNYIFTGLYIKNVDWPATNASGELIFRPEGAVGEWSFINQSTEYITKRQNAQGYDVFDIFVTSNMVLKFEFYRTFEVSYSVDYQDIGDGLGDVIKDSGASAPPIDSFTQSGQLYEIYQYNSQIRLTAPETNEDYQFVGWQVNGDNIYTELESIFPGSSVFTRWFRLYQNSEDRGVYDGLDLQQGGSDVYEIEIIAIYQPIFKISVINEIFFYNHDVDDENKHWNSWIPTNEFGVKFYEYFSEAQINQGEGDGRYALAAFQAEKNIFTSPEPQFVQDVYNQTIPERAIKSEYDNQYPEWSLVRETVDNPNSDYWQSKQMYTVTKYYKMLMEHLTNPQDMYNFWTDNILYMNINLNNAMTLLEWQYYNWDTGEYEEIPYESNNGANNPKVTTYHINLRECDFIDHTKPFIIRPLYQKKVTLNLHKKAFYYYMNDGTQIGNSAQQPQIINSEGTDTTSTFNYYDTATIVPRAGEGYRFLGWFIEEYANILDDTLIETVLGEESTVAWEVHLIFEFDDIQQNIRNLYARYMKQWEIIVESRNIAIGQRLRSSAPKLVLDLASLPEDEDCYDLKANEDFYIEIVIDAGQDFFIVMDRDDYGDDEGTTDGFNSKFDKEYRRYGLSDSQDIISENSNEELLDMRLYSYTKRTVSIIYETFGEIIFENLMSYSSVRLPDPMAKAISDRFPDEFPTTPIRIYEQDGSEPGKVSFDRIPIRNANYLGNSFQHTYNFVPYGFTDDYSITVDNSLIAPQGYVVNYGHFDSRSDPDESGFRKKISLDYSAYIMFGIGDNNNPPGTMGNPYLIGGAGKSVAQARHEFRNIDVFFNYNGASVEGVVFQLESDIHLNDITSAGQNPSQAWSWIPICYQNGKGFNGTLLGQGHQMLSLYVNGEGEYFPPTDLQALSGDKHITRYDYGQHGYGIFAHIQNGVIDNLVLGAAVIRLNQIKSDDNISYLNIYNNVGYLAARISGSETSITNIEVSETGTGYAGDNIHITCTTATGVGVIAGTISCETNMYNEISANFSNIDLSSKIYVAGRENVGGIAGQLARAQAIDVKVTGTDIIRVLANMQNGGGLFGSVIDGRIYDSYVDTIFNIGGSSGTSYGGLIGYSLGADYGSIIDNCYIIGNVNSYIEESRSGNGDNIVPSRSSGMVGGLIGSNEFGSALENSRIEGNIKLLGFYTGGLVGYNEGTVRDCVLNVSTNPFNIVVETPMSSNGGYGILVGFNAYDDDKKRNGLIIDCGILGTGSNESFNSTNRRMFVYQQGYGSDITPGTDASLGAGSSVNQSVQDGHTSIGGIAGLNEGRVFNTFIKNTKIVVAKNNPAKYYVHIGGIVGFNNVGGISVTNVRGISSSYSDGNAFLLSNVMFADGAHDNQGKPISGTAARIGMGGVAGGSTDIGAGSDPNDFSIRYSYAINNSFVMRSVAYGTGFEGYGDIIWGIGEKYRPLNKHNYVYVTAGLVVGGANPGMSRYYYCWGATNGSFQDTGDYYSGSPLRAGLYIGGINTSSHDEFKEIYGTSRYEDADNSSYTSRSVLINDTIEIMPLYASAYGVGAPMNGNNRLLPYTAFIGGIEGAIGNEQITDSRVFRTNENGQLVHNNRFNDWDIDGGGYIGDIPYSELEEMLVPYQQTYTLAL